MNPIYAVAVNTGEAADKLQQEMANQSNQLNQGALNNGTGGGINQNFAGLAGLAAGFLGL